MKTIETSFSIHAEKLWSKWTLLSLLVFFSFAAVPAECNDSPKITNENSGVIYNNLQTAINAASPGDTLKIKGTCIGGFVITQSITLEGDDNAVLDGANAARVVTIQPAVTNITVTLEDLTIQNGLANQGGGILNAAANLILNDVDVVHNTAFAGPGGGILNLSVQPIGFLENFSQTDPNICFNKKSNSKNRHANKSDILNLTTAEMDDPIILGIATLTLTDSKVDYNKSSTSGGGIANNGGVINISDSEIKNNAASTSGGGIFSAVGTNTIENSEINHNLGALVGGGIHAVLGSNTAITKSRVESNSAGLGAGIYNSASILTVNHSKVKCNTASNIGGGLYNEATSTASFNVSKVNDNIADLLGGGIFNLGILELFQTVVQNNSPDNIIDQSAPI